MSFLIFCTFEVGGLPFRMAEILNRFGYKTYYIHLGKETSDHDSTRFHYGAVSKDWDVSKVFRHDTNHPNKLIDILKSVKTNFNISHCLATGMGSYLLNRAGIHYKYWSYGADLDQDCFMRTYLVDYSVLMGLLAHPFRVYFIRQRARESISSADSVMTAPYQKYERAMICPHKPMFFLPAFQKIIDYGELEQLRFINRERICTRLNVERYFFSSTRHVWASYQSKMSDNKGNNVILDSYARYLKKTNDLNSKLVLINKGPDVKYSRILAEELNITKHIEWLDEMKRDDLDRYYQGAAICFGQFGTPVINCSILEPLANGSIGISFSILERSNVLSYTEDPPILNCKDPEKIAEFMAKILCDKEYYKKSSYQSWLWVKNHCSEEKFVESFVELFRVGC